MDGNGDFQAFFSCKDLVHHPIEWVAAILAIVDGHQVSGWGPYYAWRYWMLELSALVMKGKFLYLVCFILRSNMILMSQLFFKRFFFMICIYKDTYIQYLYCYQFLFLCALGVYFFRLKPHHCPILWDLDKPVNPGCPWFQRVSHGRQVLSETNHHAFPAAGPKRKWIIPWKWWRQRKVSGRIMITQLVG